MFAQKRQPGFKVLGVAMILGLLGAGIAVTAQDTPDDPEDVFVPSVGGAMTSSPQAGFGLHNPIAFAFGYATGVDGGTTVGISAAGNVIQYTSPAGYEHIGIGALSEGYVLCYVRPGAAVATYDTGSAMVGWAAPVVAAPQITRRTADNVMELKQAFSFSGIKKALTIKHTIKNVSTVPITSVVFRRLADFDPDTGGANGWANFLNRFSLTKDSVSGWNMPSDAPAGRTAHGMNLQHNQETGGATHIGKITGVLDSACSPAAAAELASLNPPADRTATLQYSLGNLNPGQSKQITLTYYRN